MPAGRYHHDDPTGRDTGRNGGPIMKRSGGKRGLGQTPKRLKRRGRRGRSY